MNAVLIAFLFAGEPRAAVSVLRCRYAYAQETRPDLPDSLAAGLTWELDPQVLASATAQPARELIVYSQPFAQCPACRALFDAVGEGDSQLKLTWVKSNFPAWVAATPTIYDPVQHQYRVGLHTLDVLKHWVGVKQPVAAPDQRVGSVRGRETLEAALETVAKYLGETNTLRLDTGRSIPLGNVTLVLASPTIIHWDLRGPARQLRFEGQQPLLRAWGMQVSCEGASYDGSTMTLRIPRFPDWKLQMLP